jgi:hypothetical protein
LNQLKDYPAQTDDVSEFYSAYAEQIQLGVWYADRHRFYDHDGAPNDGWSVLAKGAPFSIASRMPYWVPHPSVLEEMRELVHQQQRRGEIQSARSAEGIPRTRQDFSRFSVQYNYDERCEINSADAALFLGDALVEDSVRLTEFDVQRRQATVEIATYLDQRATNMNPDAGFASQLAPLRAQTTFRELDSTVGRLRALHVSYQANTIGIACVLVGRDAVPILTMRSKAVAVMNQGSRLHCSSSGALKWDDLSDIAPHDPTSLALADALAYGMTREIAEELELKSDEYELTLTDFARELPRAGKPQFFFVARSEEKAESLVNEISERTKRTVKAGTNVGAWEREQRPQSLFEVFFHPSRRIAGVTADSGLRLDRVANGEIDCRSRPFTYEGFASLVFAAQYFRDAGLFVG